MGDQTFDDYLKTRAICLTVGDVGKLEEEVIRYMRESWGEAVKLEREQCAKAAEEVDEPGWTGYECPNTFNDGKWAAAAAIRARGEPNG